MTPALPSRLIVADIGATNGRFAIATRQPDHSTTLSQMSNIPCASVNSLEALLERYIDELAGEVPMYVCLAIAGPNNGRSGHITNLDWIADASALEQRFGLKGVSFANDFAALACMAPRLPESSLVTIKHGTAVAGAAVSVIGPGTGLGVSIVVPTADDFITVSTEGGHQSFAPVTDREKALRDYLQPGLGHVSIETVLCGRGLARINDFLVATSGNGMRGLDPAEVSSAAIAGTDETCAEAVRLFLQILASAAGDFALVHGALGGVFIGGGILPRLKPMLSESAFSERFCAKGPMQSYLEQIPVYMINADHVAMHGAANLYRGAI